MDHDTLDDFWQAIRFDDRYDTFDVPCLHVTGWYDLEDLLGAFHHYEGMMAASPAREQQRLIVGPWSHVNSRNPHSSYAEVECGPEAALEMDDIHLAWFDHWLKGKETGALDTPPVRLWETGSHRWRDEDRWPLATGERSLYLGWDGKEGSLSETPSASQDPDRSYRYDPLDPVPTRMDVKRYPIEDVPVEMTEIEARDDVVTYTSAPLHGNRHRLRLAATRAVGQQRPRRHRMARQADRRRRGRPLDQGLPGLPARLVPRFAGAPDAAHARRADPLPDRAVAGPPRLPARPPHPRLGHVQRFPLVRPQHEPVRPAQGPGRAAGGRQHAAPRRSLRLPDHPAGRGGGRRRARGGMTIRDATPDDAAAIARIYNQGIEDRLATLETQSRTPEERAEWLAARGPRHPVLVAVDGDGAVVGWGSLNAFNPRPAYDHVADFSVYVAREARGPRHRRRAPDRVGRAAPGRWAITSWCWPPSRTTRRGCASTSGTGSRRVGVYREHGWLDGRWVDVIVMEKILG